MDKNETHDREGNSMCMIEGKVAGENAYVGRTYRDAPDIDGLCFYQYG